MISFNIIREDVLPSTQIIPEFNFISGEKRMVAIQILNKYDKQPFFVLSGYEIKAKFLTSSGVPIVKIGSIRSDNRSIVTFDLSIEDTMNVISGRLVIELINEIDVTDIKKAVKENAIVKTRI